MAENTVQANPPETIETNPVVGMERERRKAAPHDEEWTRAAAKARWGTLEQRFWSRVAKLPGDRCWIWTGAKITDGYGRLEALGKKKVLAHRLAWFIEHGELPPVGMVVRHRCDNPACVRIDHLLLGTQKENIQDSMIRGRHGSLKQTGKKRGPYRKKAA